MFESGVAKLEIVSGCLEKSQVSEAPIKQSTPCAFNLGARQFGGCCRW
jgi:hypothetical protein